MSRFNQRLSKGQQLQNYLTEYLDHNGISYFLTGYEGLTESNGAKLKIIKNDSTTSMFVRHYPDITIATSKDSYLLEVKNSSGIEKECWEAYSKLHKHLGINVLFLLKDKMIYNIESIRFNPMHEYDVKAGMNIPVTDGVWKEPRMLNDSDYYKYLDAYGGRTSGCSFAFIDFNGSTGHPIETLLKLKLHD